MKVSPYSSEGDPPVAEEDWSDAQAWPDEASAPLGVFTVVGDRLDPVAATPGVVSEARRVWERFTELVPTEQRTMVARFELLPADADGAYVAPLDEDPTRWVLGVARGLGEDLDQTLVHEFGHLLTLRASQVPPAMSDDDVDRCSTYFTGEGCSLESSIVNRFVERLWPSTMLEELARIEESGDWDAADAFYRDHREQFVTDYAAMNPGEDLAETFTVFVFEDRPTGSTVADEKVRFFWEYPSMVEIRTMIRAALVGS